MNRVKKYFGIVKNFGLNSYKINDYCKVNNIDLSKQPKTIKVYGKDVKVKYNALGEPISYDTDSTSDHIFVENNLKSDPKLLDKESQEFMYVNGLDPEDQKNLLKESLGSMGSIDSWKANQYLKKIGKEDNFRNNLRNHIRTTLNISDSDEIDDEELDKIVDDYQYKGSDLRSKLADLRNQPGLQNRYKNKAKSNMINKALNIKVTDEASAKKLGTALAKKMHGDKFDQKIFDEVFQHGKDTVGDDPDALAAYLRRVYQGAVEMNKNFSKRIKRVLMCFGKLQDPVKFITDMLNEDAYFDNLRRMLLDTYEGDKDIETASKEELLKIIKDDKEFKDDPVYNYYLVATADGDSSEDDINKVEIAIYNILSGVTKFDKIKFKEAKGPKFAGEGSSDGWVDVNGIKFYCKNDFGYGTVWCSRSDAPKVISLIRNYKNEILDAAKNIDY